MLRAFLVPAMLICSCAFTAATAARIEIVALGASNTAGQGVGSGAAFAAQLEAMLRAKGYDVRIANAGISGDTSAGMLSRLDSAVPDGTRIVLLHVSGYNDARRGYGPQERQASTNAIVSRLHARGIKVIMVNLGGIPSSDFQADAIHLNSHGHAVVAASLPPQVIAALGRLR